MRDFQRQKVYDWESQYIAPKDRSRVTFSNAQNLVNYVWEQEGLQYPPKVVPIAEQTRRFCGKANRLYIQLHEKQRTPTYVILHEIAHSMTSEHCDDVEVNDRHGAKFMGVFMRLLDKHMGVPLSLSMYTAGQEKIQFDTTAKPFCVMDIDEGV